MSSITTNFFWVFAKNFLTKKTVLERGRVPYKIVDAYT